MKPLTSRQKRTRLFEFEDQKWFPNLVREGMTDYLRHVSAFLGFYRLSIPLLVNLINSSGETAIIEVCAGSGALSVWEELDGKLCSKTSIIISDIYPNASSQKNRHPLKNIDIRYNAESVDALAVPSHHKGIRAMFSALHHFEPAEATVFLKDAAEKKISIALFDVGTNNIFLLLLMLVLHPIFFLIFTPFIRPLNFSRFIFTYLIPLIPLCTMWDGSISILRFYSIDE